MKFLKCMCMGVIDKAEEPKAVEDLAEIEALTVVEIALQTGALKEI